MRGRAYVEIDRSRSDAWAILSRPRHTLGEAGFRPPAASSAAVNHPLMLDDHEAGFRQIKHLPLLNAHNHRRRQSGKAMATCLRLAPLNDVRLGGRLQRAPACTRLSSARLARLAAQGAGNARRFFQPVARRRLAAVRAVRLQPAPKLRYLLAQRRVLRAQNLNLALKRRNQIANLGAEKHSYVNFIFPNRRPEKSSPHHHFLKYCAPANSTSLAVTKNRLLPPAGPDLCREADFDTAVRKNDSTDSDFLKLFSGAYSVGCWSGLADCAFEPLSSWPARGPFSTIQIPRPTANAISANFLTDMNRRPREVASLFAVRLPPQRFRRGASCLG